MQMPENKAKCSVHPDLEKTLFDETAQVYRQLRIPHTLEAFHSYVMPFPNRHKIYCWIFRDMLSEVQTTMY